MINKSVFINSQTPFNYLENKNNKNKNQEDKNHKMK